MKKRVNVIIKLGVILLIFQIIFLMSCSNSEQTFGSIGFSENNYLPIIDEVTVFKIVDGDTFWIKNQHGHKVKIRLIGIDAPEDRNMFNKKKHPFGKVSKKYLDSLILDKKIRLEYDVDSLDQYGRTLAYAYLNEIFINENMIRNGYAILMTIPPNVRFVSQFIDGQNYARTNRIGIWNLDLIPNFE